MSKMIFEIDLNDLEGARKVKDILNEMLSNELPWEVDPSILNKDATATDPSKIGFGKGATPAPAAQAAPTPAPAVPTPPTAQAAPTPAPAVPTPPAAQAAQLATTHATASDVELDNENLPWDGRIHSSGKTKTKNGNWKRKKGVSSDLVDQVVAELRGQPVQQSEPAQSVIESENPMAVVNKFIEDMTAAIQLGDVEEDDLFAALNGQGLSGLTDIIRRPDLIPSLTEQFIPNY